jgi:hypothetical protein
MDTTLEVLSKQYQSKRMQIVQALSSGAAKDYAEYRAMCGEVRGLLTAEIYIEDLAKHLETDDDE